MRKQHLRIGLQMKFYRRQKVQAAEVRNFIGSLQLADLPQGIFLTTTSFTENGRAYAAKCNIDLLDRQQTRELLTQHARDWLLTRA